MIDLFIRTTPNKSRLRKRFFAVTIERWALDKDSRLLFLRDKGIREARIFAEQGALTDPYIFCDDDILIVVKD